MPVKPTLGAHIRHALHGATRCAERSSPLQETPEMDKHVADQPMPLSGVKVLELG